MVTHASTDSRYSLPAFADQLFEHLPRTDQRKWARVYLEALMATRGKKTVRRLAASVSDSPTASQSLHQFVNASPWDWTPVRQEMARWVESRLTPRAWLLDLAVIRKRGEHSCGVHRRFVPATGRSATCQVGVGAFLATADAAIPVDWRLLLPGSWTNDPRRRLRARIPEDIGPQPIEDHALALTDFLAGSSRPVPGPVVADLATVPGAHTLVRGLAIRNRDFVIAVPAGFKVVLGRHLHLQKPSDAGERGLALAARSLFEFDSGLTHAEVVDTADANTRRLEVRSVRVYLPDTHPSFPPRTYSLFTVASENSRRPVQTWLTSLTHARAAEVVGLTRLLAHSQEAVRRMESDFGLLDFEGRSYPGWHHHMTLVSAAYAYSRTGHLSAVERPEAA
ncbi:IS701 family transposase [Streptomyces sp. NPDC000348]|uniref:IS701 family transposase n=1 Tax=Streptomyces sp. NPDC000348 TaxID=3364538 RepID=UPI0036787E09